MIKLEEVIAVSGQPNLFRLVASRSNGLILEDYITKKTNFFSARTYQFSPLESISMYTLGDNIALKEVFERFSKAEMEVPATTSTDPELKIFFASVIKEYDPYRVHAKDIKKAVKWFHQLKNLGFDPEANADAPSPSSES
jgi:Domain of unknown function (DUF5606)